MKKISLFVMWIVVSFSLVGCSQDQTKKIDELNAKTLELYSKLDLLTDQDFTNKYKDGEFDCHNPYGIQKVKFLSSRVIFIYGVTEYNEPMYNNYYVINLIGKNKYEIVDEVKLPDTLNKVTIEFLRSEWAMGFTYLREINILDNGEKLTIANEPTEVCTFIKQ